MRYVKIPLVALVAIFSMSVCYGKPTDKKQIKLEVRVKQLEDYKENIANVSKIQVEEVKKHADEEIKKGLISIEEAKKTLNLLVYVGIPGTIISLIVIFFGAVKYARKLVLDKIGKIVEGNRQDILQIIETEAFDTRLKNNKQLLVISGTQESETSLKKFMEKLKFKKVAYRVTGTFTDVPEHDLMIFNNQDGTLTQEVVNSLMASTDDEDICYVAFTMVNLERNSRLNFSNSRFTLYHSILSTLKYSDIAKFTD